jgi:hypothetical protein
MPNLDDVFNAIQAVNGNLQQLHTDLDDLKAETTLVKQSIDQGLANVATILNAGFTNIALGVQALLELQMFADQTLVHQSHQNDTIICALEHVSENTCGILNEAHTQTALQISIDRHARSLAEMYRTVNPAAALELKRLDDLKAEILACCPPEPTPPICTYQPCPKPPEQQGSPPTIAYTPYKG